GPAGQPGQRGEGVVEWRGIELGHIRGNGDVVGHDGQVEATVLGKPHPGNQRFRSRAGAEVRDVDTQLHGLASSMATYRLKGSSAPGVGTYLMLSPTIRRTSSCIVRRIGATLSAPGT